MKHKISRQETIYAVALAGISAAVALLMVWLGVVVRFSTVAFFIAASIAVMVPASQKYYFSSVFAYLVSAGLSFLVAGDVFSVMGYVVYFGPMAIITATFFNYKDKVKWWIALIVKMVYINGALAILYFLCNNIVIDESIIDKVQYWMIALFGTIILVAVDYLLQFIYKRAGILLSRVLRKKAQKRVMPTYTKMTKKTPRLAKVRLKNGVISPRRTIFLTMTKVMIATIKTAKTAMTLTTIPTTISTIRMLIPTIKTTKILTETTMRISRYRR